MGVSRDQAAGAVGLLLQLARAHLTDAEFLRVADAIPAISDIIAKSPEAELRISGRWRACLSRWLGGGGNLTPIADGFQELGMEPEKLHQAVAALVDYFRQQGDDEVSQYLQRTLR